MASTGYREGGKPRSSIAWEHFEVQDKDRGIATCNLCRENFSFRSSVSNLMKHLKGKHAFVMDSSRDDDGGAERETDMEQKSDGNMKSKIKSEVYEYYEFKDDDALATCSICLEGIIFTSETVLTEHLNSKHNIQLKHDNKDYKSDDEGTDGEKMTLQQLSEAKSGRTKSAAWDHFEVKDEVRMVASCNLCGALCSYKSSVSNLMKHVRRKHDIGSMRIDDEEEEKADGDGKHTSMTRAQRSIVWLYFKCVDPESKLSECLICKKLLSHSTTLTNLKKHLARKHPNVKIPAREDGRKRILLSSGGELYEVETGSKLDDDEVQELNDAQDTTEMDTVFLEDFDALEDQAPKKRKLTKTASKSVNRNENYYSSSSEEEVTFVNRYVKKQSDSFDHFAKYIASLLRELPKETSSQLQTDFVKQIMEAKHRNEF